LGRFLRRDLLGDCQRTADNKRAVVQPRLTRRAYAQYKGGIVLAYTSELAELANMFHIVPEIYLRGFCFSSASGHDARRASPSLRLAASGAPNVGSNSDIQQLPRPLPQYLRLRQ
jgi:hypothetical protein